MKKMIMVCVIIASLSVSFANPSHAIFGLSKCEKVKRAINSEEQVGMELWKEFNSQRNTLLRNPNATWQDLGDLIKITPEMVDSDMRIYKLADSNAFCFSSKEIVVVRQGISQAKRSSKNIETILSIAMKPRSAVTQLTAKDRQLVKNLAPKYKKIF